MGLENPFLSYIDRSYNQIKQAVLNRLAVLVPEITDHNESNFLIRAISVWAGIAEMIGYYLDNMARETFLTQCRLYFTAVKIAEQYDYRIASAQAATVDLVFTFQRTTGGAFPGFLIPAGTEVQTDGGIAFFTIADTNVPASSLNTITVTVAATNARQVVGLNLGNSDGTANQEFELPSNVAGFSVVALVSAVAWANVETFAYSGPSDQDFKQTVNTNKKVVIRFGDGVNGEIPTAAATITVNYDECDGEGGNVDANSLTNIISVLPPPAGFTLTVTNPNRAAGGVNVESLDSIKKHVPLLLRTQNRAVTEQDFIDIGNLHPQVEQTSVFFECGKTVDVYIVPNGGGIASSVLLADVLAWYEPRRIITTQLNVFAAGEIRIQLELTLRVLPNYVQNNVVTDVLDNLLDFFSVENQQIGGTLHISDIYEVIENTVGVSSSTITAIVPVPYARPDAANATQVLTWTPVLQQASTTTNKWEILFTSAVNYQLFKDGNFVGSFAAGAQVVQPEIIFTITGSYVIGDKFEFYTYPYSADDLELVEQSIPAALSSDIAINPIGGI